MKVMIFAGTRPNVVKCSSFFRRREISSQQFGIELSFCLIAQQEFSLTFKTLCHQLGIDRFDNLIEKYKPGLPGFDSVLNECSKLIIHKKPDYIMVFGDVDTASLIGMLAMIHSIPLIHVEAGLRSFDETMPEEINRIVLDRISSALFVTEPSGIDNLRAEGLLSNAYLVGNIMIDTLVDSLSSGLLRRHESSLPRCLLTLHRPSNVDSPQRYTEIVSSVIAKSPFPVVLVSHPRTVQMARDLAIRYGQSLEVVPPMPYFEFVQMVLDSSIVFTDSGGLQEETSYLNVPCVTLRPSTERPVTVSHGSNILCPDLSTLDVAISQALSKCGGSSIDLWDGRSADRILSIMARW